MLALLEARHTEINWNEVFIVNAGLGNATVVVIGVRRETGQGNPFMQRPHNG